MGSVSKTFLAAAALVTASVGTVQADEPSHLRWEHDNGRTYHILQPDILLENAESAHALHFDFLNEMVLIISSLPDDTSIKQVYRFSDFAPERIEELRKIGCEIADHALNKEQDITDYLKNKATLFYKNCPKP